MKKIAIAFCALLFSTSVAYANFSDVTASTQYAVAIDYVESSGYVNGYPDGSYKPDDLINRAEFTKIVVNAFGYTSEVIDGCTEKKSFPDIVVSEWYVKFVCIAKQEKIINGYPDGTFKPNGEINFAEAAKIIVKTYDREGAKGYTNKTSSVWYETFVNALKDRDAVPATIESNDQLITRGEMAYMIWKFEGLGITQDDKFDGNYNDLISGKNNKYVSSQPEGFILETVPSEAEGKNVTINVNPDTTSTQVHRYIPSGWNSILNNGDMVEYYLHIEGQTKWYGPFKERIWPMPQ